MRKHAFFIPFKSLAFAAVIIAFSSGFAPAAEQGRTDLTEAMKQSIVYLNVSFYGYERTQPWKHKDLSENWACGCAVGKYEVITPAWNIANAAFVKAIRYGQNEFVGAKIKIVDYESNLCLLELDPNGMTEPLRPLVFTENYRKGAEVAFYWLSSDNYLYNGRAFLDRARVEKTNTSYEQSLHYVAANASRSTGSGQVYCAGSEPIGIACWYNDNKEAGLIPAERINRFLAAAADDDYKGFGSVGFAASELLDPAMRSFLKMPQDLKAGIYVTDVYNLGTACDVLKSADVILAIDGNVINSHGRFMHPKYEWLHYHHLITSKAVGQTVKFELWRDGRKKKVKAEVKNFDVSEMLVPYYEYDRQSEYVITAGFILQRLTREYMAQWGDDWIGKVSPHLYHYYRDLAFKPTPERSDIVILSFVLPANINLGYKDIGQIVLEKFNGMTIRSIADIPKAQKLNPESKYDVLEFELDNPVVVIPRDQLPAADLAIGRNYRISKLANIEQ